MGRRKEIFYYFSSWSDSGYDLDFKEEEKRKPKLSVRSRVKSKTFEFKILYPPTFHLTPAFASKEDSAYKGYSVKSYRHNDKFVPEIDIGRTSTIVSVPKNGRSYITECSVVRDDRTKTGRRRSFLREQVGYRGLTCTADDFKDDPKIYELLLEVCKETWGHEDFENWGTHVNMMEIREMLGNRGGRRVHGFRPQGAEYPFWAESSQAFTEHHLGKRKAANPKRKMHPNW